MAPRSKPFNQFPRDPALGDQALQALDQMLVAINQLQGQAAAPTGSGINALSVNSIDPTASTIASAGSRTSAVTTGLQFVLTPTTATFYWDGTNGSTRFQIWRDDGTTFGPTIVGSPIVVSGLVANTLYFFYAYWDEGSQLVKFVNVPGTSVGTPAIAFTTQSLPAAQQQILRGHIPISPNLATTGITTPNSGSSSGSGGSGGSGSGGHGYR